MWEKLLGWMVARSIPRDLIDPHEELIASEAAESAVRQAVMLTAVAAGVVLLLVVALIYRTAPIGGTPPKSELVAAEAARQLGAENASLVQANAELRKKIDDLTRESDGFHGRLIEADKELADLRAARETAASPRKETAVAAARPEQAPRQEAAVSAGGQPGESPAKAAASVTATAAEPAPKPEPHAVKKVAAPMPARAHTAVRSPGSYQCGDGRSVHDPRRCSTMREVPAEVEVDLDPRRSYQCGDGQTVRDPAQCRSVTEAFSRER